MNNILSQSQKPTILVTGATGYIGGRLVPRLLKAGYSVKAMSRSYQKLQARPWYHHPNVELIAGDTLNLADLQKASKGCDMVYYLVHSMVPGQTDFEEADRVSAQNMTIAAEHQNVKRIIYLGGLGLDTPTLSQHLRSRHEVADILQQGPVPVTVFNAAMIIGSGSASFEILRYLVDRLPIMVTPKWVNTPVQPIAISNVLEYLIACLNVGQTIGKSFDIGGADTVTYLDLMKIYAQEAGLPQRVVFPVPVLTPRLSSYWIHLVTPLPAHIARPLAEGLKNPVVCRNHDITYLLPQKLLSCQEAIARAVKLTFDHHIETHWTDSGTLPIEQPQPGDPDWSGGTELKDHQQLIINAPIKSVWESVAKIGGNTGWYYGNWLWQLRGMLDKLIGGAGLQRGRRDPHQLRLGDAVDFWRVAAIAPSEHLTLVAEMKLPGKAILEFHLKSLDTGKTLLQQKARFFPKGIFGLLYWYSTMPLHAFIFPGMIQGIANDVLQQYPASQSQEPVGAQ